MAKTKTVIVEEDEFRFYTIKEEDYFSITDVARKFNPENPSSLIINWLRNKDTIDFLGVWEQLNNPDFNLIEFDKIKNEAGYNRFILSAKRWITGTNAVGIKSKSGRYGGTFAHKDIALGFCYWISPPFQLYLIKEFQRLKEIESVTQKETLEWNVKRIISKANYKVHTDAIKEKLIPPRVTNASGVIYAGEADVLNVAIFGMTAKTWEQKYTAKKGNVRDYATTEQLLVLSNLEAINAELIRNGLSQNERIIRLNEAAISQMQSLLSSPSLKHLPRNK